MSDLRIKLSQGWAMALRTLMTYPSPPPPFYRLAWCASSPRDSDQIMDLVTLATGAQRDIVHLAFQLDTEEPVSISMAIRCDRGTEWIPNMVPYCASETAKLELLADASRWKVGPGEVLTSVKLPPKDRLEQGVAVAKRRWRQAAEAMRSRTLAGSVWIPDSGSYADAIPWKGLRLPA